MSAYLIWSHEHGAWWAPDERGYVKKVSQAGRYPRHLALMICFNAGWPHMSPPNEVPVLESDVLELDAMAKR